MGFFNRGNSAIIEGASLGLEEVLENAEEIMPKYDNFDEAALCNILEADINYNNIMEAVALEEMDYYEAHGTEIVYEAGGLSGFFAKVKAFFVNLYQKIKGLFKKFIAMIDSYAKNDKSFVEKYRKHLLTVNTRGFEYKGYDFNDAAISGTAGKIENAMDKAYSVTGLPSITSVNAGSADVSKNLAAVEDQTETVDKMRAAALSGIGASGAGTSADSSEMTKTLFIHFRKDDAKSTLEGVNVSTQLSYITNYANDKKAAEKSFKSLEKTINATLKSLDRMEKEASDKVPGENQTAQSNHVRLIHAVITFTKHKLSIGQTINGALLTALKDRSRQAKSICVALMNYKPKNESAGYYEEGAIFGSALDSVIIK